MFEIYMYYDLTLKIFVQFHNAEHFQTVFFYFRQINIEMQYSGTEVLRKAYATVNCCSQGASISQILAIGFFVGIEILSFNLIASMLAQQSAAMHFLIALSYLSLLLLLIEYIHLLIVDPSDPRLKNKTFHQEGVEEKQCETCQCKVSISSYHCQSCQRCVDGFDHHCTFANNCIGARNYSIFIRLVIGIIAHTSANMGIAVWLSLALAGSYKWLAVVFGSLSFIVFAQITVLAIFHCYISFCLYKTTLEVLKGDQPKTVSIKIIKQSRQSGEQSNIDMVKGNNNLVNNS